MLYFPIGLSPTYFKLFKIYKKTKFEDVSFSFASLFFDTFKLEDVVNDDAHNNLVN